MSQTVEITVDLKGKTTVVTKGFAGNACQEASRFVEAALGRRLGERLTAEFYDVQPTQHDTRQRL